MTSTMSGRQMMTLAEAADRLGLHPSTLRHQIRRGAISAEKIGRDWMVSADEIERYRRENRRRERQQIAADERRALAELSAEEGWI
jgi:excisionase family DNA binding protein